MIMLMLLFAACSSKDDDEPQTVKPTVLTLYVYSPLSPMQTRSNTGYINPSGDEATVKSLQVWIFRHTDGTDDGQLVGYMTPNNADILQLNANGTAVYQMVVDNDFAEAPTYVDVYAVANMTLANSAVALDGSTTREELEAALMKEAESSVPEGVAADPFGITSLTTGVPADGLPMTGALRAQPVVGEAPVLRIGTATRVAAVPLVRTMSKVIVLFTRAEATEHTVDITGVSLDGSQIPVSEYLFLTGDYDERSSHIGNTYQSEEATIMTETITHSTLRTCEIPDDYAYHGQDDYWSIIVSGLDKNELTLGASCYLRESNKRVSGRIDYTVDGVASSAPFQMAAAGDFSRNHVWIVYAYYGSATLDVISVAVTDWRQLGDHLHDVYNW